MSQYQLPPKDPNEDYIVFVALFLALFLFLPLWSILGGLLIAFYKAFYPVMGGDMTVFMINASPLIFFAVLWLALIVLIKGWFIPWWRLRTATKTIKETLKAEMEARTGQVIVQEKPVKKGNDSFVLAFILIFLLIGFFTL